jgi:hypothetical protein
MEFDAMKWLRMGSSRPKQYSQSGQALIILALGFVGLLSFVGLVTDVSIMLVRHNQLVRAVDSAALNAANQMRSDRSFGQVGVAARMMIEMHGFDSENVLVETCASTGGLDDYLCSQQNRYRKLVRVGATVDSPTVFLQLIGFQAFELSAVSTSETAVLDVVMVMDVSESMLLDTTYLDWAKIGFGRVYVPPLLEDANGPEAGTGIREKEQAAGRFDGPTRRGIVPGMFPNPHFDEFGFYDNLIQFPAVDLFGDVGNLGRVYPDEVNARLWYPNDGDVVAANAPNLFYSASSFDYPGYGAQAAPRRGCRVQFWPYSTRRPINDAIRLIPGNTYDTLWEGKSIYDNSSLWSGFIPTYDFYGCCNDPTNGGRFAYSEDGTGPIGGVWTAPTANPANAGDNRFTDLICQPFKEARDATRAFIQTLDFERGDRVALVTFDRGAFLIDPDGSLGADPAALGTCPRDPDPVAGRTALTHMMASFCRANQTLLNHVGVRAEPNFYDWDENGGSWVRFADGLTNDGDSNPVDYYREGSGNPSAGGYVQADRAYNQYPVNNNCPMFDAALSGYYSRYSLSKWDVNNNAYYVNILNGAPGLARIMTPPLGGGLTVDNGYDLRASCRGTNIGAGLREANNALLDPTTTRRSGAVWVIVMLGDGAAGASDPVRSNGRKLLEADPFFDRGFDPANWLDYGAETNAIRYGDGGEYGAFGLCPVGNGLPNGSELLDTTENPPRFPYCSDEQPHVRHFCTPAGKDDRNVGIQCFGQGATVRGMGFAPGSKDNDYACFSDTGTPGDALPGENEGSYNYRSGNIYDVDIGPAGNGMCDPLYDVDDYARDWADYVGLSESGGGDEQLPTIFTIGFGLSFSRNSPGNGAPGSAADNIEDFLGEELLRYIADVGDNFKIDTDYQQDLLEDQELNGRITNNNSDPFGARGPCEDQSITPSNYEVGNPAALMGDGFFTANPGYGRMVIPLPPTQDCGNYYNAPDQSRLRLVFDDIASRMFTRLAP